MTKIALVANLVARSENRDEVEQALLALVEATRGEDGTEAYVMNREPEDPQSFWFYEMYSDAEALGVHGAGPGMTAMLAAIDGKLAEPPMIKTLTPVAAKGIEV